MVQIRTRCNIITFFYLYWGHQGANDCGNKQVYCFLRLNCKLCETFLLYDFNNLLSDFRLGQPYKQERLSLTYKVTG